MIVVDTSFVYALLDRREPRQGQAAAWYRGLDEALATTPLAIAEADYFAARIGPAARSAFHRDLTAGVYAVEWWAEAPAEIAAITEQYADLGLSLTDASLVALAGRLGTVAVATFDERHFRAVRPLSGATAFTLLPADAR